MGDVRSARREEWDMLESRTWAWSMIKQGGRGVVSGGSLV